MNRSLLALAAARDNMTANPLRTLLSTLGVVIGVASLVAILALGDGLERFGREQISQTTDLHSVLVAPRTESVVDGVRIRRDEVPRLEEADAAALRERLGERATAVLFLVGSARASLPGDTAWRAVVAVATGPEAVTQLPEGLAAGRYLTRADVEGEARVVVVDPAFAEWVGVEPESLLGREVELDGLAYEVIGVDAAGGGNALRVHVPLSGSARARLEDRDRVVGVAVRAHRIEDVEAAQADVEAWLEDRFGGTSDFAIRSRKAMATQARRGMLVFKLVMGAIAGIALLVGGIGIMNILLASVFERTREIGIRKASGARQRDILLQFLGEAVAVTAAGSLLGVVLGLVGAFGITAGIRQISEAPVYAAFTWGSVLVAALAALLVGLAFGTYPARRASRLSPIEAIRHE